MGAIKLNTFGGMVPAVDDRLLPDNAAAHAENTWLYSGALFGLPKPVVIHQIASGTNKAFRIPENYAKPTPDQGSLWLEFVDPLTDVIRAPVFDDTFDRYYFASTTRVPRYNTKARIANGDDPFTLGIPTAARPASLATAGGSAAAVTRAYLVTWASAYGEEGAPSRDRLETAPSDATWTLTLTPPEAEDLEDRNLETARIYRTITSASGVATFFLVAEVPIATTSYDDTATDSDVAQNTQLRSTGWTPPPEDLQGFVAMPNGIIAAWRANELWFSEPYRPHAWPAAYVLTVEFPIVGLGVAGQTLVVCTQGFPMTAYGVHPASITTSKLTTFEPCVSRRSILSTPEGVYYASPNGLVVVAAGRAENITKDIITKDTWQTLTKLTDLQGARLGTAYFAFGTIRPGVFEDGAFEESAFEQEDFTGGFQGVLIDPRHERVAVTVLRSAEPILASYNDAWSGEVLMIRGDDVLWLDQGNPLILPEPYKWRSKVFQTPDRRNFGALRIYFGVPDGMLAPSAQPDNSLVQELDALQYGLVRVYADGRHVLTREMRTSGELLRLPSGFKADFWQVEIEARVRVFSVQLASTAKELRSV